MDPSRETLRATFGDISPPLPDPQRIVTRGRRARLREHSVRAIVGLVAAVAIVAPLIALLGITEGAPQVPAGGETRIVSSDGISVEVPVDMGGSFFEIAGFSRDVLVVANVPIPADVSDSLREVRTRLESSGDLLIWMVEYVGLCPPCEEFGLLDAPLQVTEEALTGYDVGSQLIPTIEPVPGHASTRLLFASQDRFFDLRVEFGSEDPSPQALAAANGVLASVSVDQTREPSGVPACSDPGGFLNTTCPAFQWLSSILQSGDLEVVGDTGTALSANNQELAVNAWIAETEAPLEGYPVWGEVQGTRVVMLGEDTIFWNAEDGRQVWIRVQSPGGSAAVGTVTVIEAIVAASNG